MQLSFLARARGQLMRQYGPRILQTPAFRERLLGWRGKPVDGQMCDEQLALLLGLGDIIGATKQASRDPATARAEMAESSMMVEDEPCPDVRVRDRVLMNGDARLHARFYEPLNLAPNSPGIVYFHGGGFVLGDLDSHDRTCQHLARNASARLIAVDYRLAPENPYPAAAEDGVAAFRCVARRAREFNMDPTRLAVMGDSAGGNLSAVTAHKTKSDAIRPALQVLIYPAVDGTCSMQSHKLFANGWVLTADQIEWFYHCYAGDELAARKRPEVSPLFETNFSDLPPALVYTAGFDPLRDEGIVYAQRLEEAKTPVRHHCFRSLIHGFVSMGGVCTAAREATRQIASEVREAFDGGLLSRT